VLDAMLRAAGRLSAIADELDRLRGRPLTAEQRATRDRLLREQQQTQARFEQAEVRVRTLRGLLGR
jgi:hypothetical protein